MGFSPANPSLAGQVEQKALAFNPLLEHKPNQRSFKKTISKTQASHMSEAPNGICSSAQAKMEVSMLMGLSSHKVH